MPITVSGLALTPVKGTRLCSTESIELERSGGVRSNRRFYVIDELGRMVTSRHAGGLTRVIADYDEQTRVLSMTFPDGSIVSAPVELGERVATQFSSRPRNAHVVVGPWAEPLSALIGQALRIVEPIGGGVDRGPRGAISLISRASLARLAEVAGEPSVDGRRFRMLIEVDGAAAHQEDDWVGSSARIGAATVRFGGNVGRCVITTRNPESGEVDFPTLKTLARYRQELPSTELLPFGVYGEVLTGGRVAVGDSVVLVD